VVRFTILAMLPAVIAGAETLSGVLVDADCYAAMERNVNPRDTLTSVDRDRDFEIRYCRPGSKTTSFKLVDHDGQSVNLDAGGNSLAAEIVQKLQKGSIPRVSITGRKEKEKIKVESIVPDLTVPRHR